MIISSKRYIDNLNTWKINNINQNKKYENKYEKSKQSESTVDKIPR